jgi:hypothetical protein
MDEYRTIPPLTKEQFESLSIIYDEETGKVQALVVCLEKAKAWTWKDLSL